MKSSLHVKPCTGVGANTENVYQFTSAPICQLEKLVSKLHACERPDKILQIIRKSYKL